MKHLGKENKKFTEPSVKILDKVENKRKDAETTLKKGKTSI